MEKQKGKKGVNNHSKIKTYKMFPEPKLKELNHELMFRLRNSNSYWHWEIGRRRWLNLTWPEYVGHFTALQREIRAKLNLHWKLERVRQRDWFAKTKDEEGQIQKPWIVVSCSFCRRRRNQERERGRKEVIHDSKKHKKGLGNWAGRHEGLDSWTWAKLCLSNVDQIN